MSKIRFDKLKLKDRFIVDGVEYIRVQDIYRGCCDVVYNARILGTDELTVINTFQLVEKIDVKY